MLQSVDFVSATVRAFLMKASSNSLIVLRESSHRRHRHILRGEREKEENIGDLTDTQKGQGYALSPQCMRRRIHQASLHS